MALLGFIPPRTAPRTRQPAPVRGNRRMSKSLAERLERGRRGPAGPPKAPWGGPSTPPPPPTGPDQIPLPPAPLIGPATAAAVTAAIVGGILWGLLNKSNDTATPVPVEPNSLQRQGQYSNSPGAVMSVWVDTGGAQEINFNAPTWVPGGGRCIVQWTRGASGWVHVGNIPASAQLNIEVQSGTANCPPQNLRLMATVGAAAPFQLHAVGNSGTGGISLPGGFKVRTDPVSGTGFEPVPLPPMIQPLPRQPSPLFDPEDFPDLLPEESPPGERPLPRRPPLTPSDVPGSDPLTPPRPGPGPTPSRPGVEPDKAPKPFPYPPILPRRGPDRGRDPDKDLQGRQDTGPDGRLLPRPRPDPKETEIGTELTPDGQIGGPGQRPPPTLDGIAGEVGRVEQKLLKLMEREPFDLRKIEDALKEALEEEPPPPFIFPRGEYLLSSPCDSPDRPPLSADWAAGVGEWALVFRKLDALAELVQLHKGLRQPICHKRAEGQPIQVDFEEVP